MKALVSLIKVDLLTVLTGPDCAMEKPVGEGLTGLRDLQELSLSDRISLVAELKLRSQTACFNNAVTFFEDRNEVLLIFDSRHRVAIRVKWADFATMWHDC